MLTFVFQKGPAGGPLEDTVTGILARSTSTKWSLNTLVAVDAGTLLAGILRILQRHEVAQQNDEYVAKEGPFAGLGLPYESPRANAGYIFREILGTILVTHPHIDHLSGLAINTPMLQGGNGPKSIAALPAVLASIKGHLFNDIIWPNMSDEDGGAGLVTYQRLIEGGNFRFGRGDTHGYVQVCHGLLAKCLGVSHGCLKIHESDGPHRHTGASEAAVAPAELVPNSEPIYSIIESSCYFICDQYTGREVVIFGDVEPDRISKKPRNRKVWEAAAPKVASGTLRAIFIECSYADSVDDTYLYGHLCPRHLIEELSVLATKTEQIKQSKQETSTRDKRADNTEVRDMFLCKDRLLTQPYKATIAEDGRVNKLPFRTHTSNQSQPAINSKDDTAQDVNAARDKTAAACHHDSDSHSSTQIEDLSSLPLCGLSIYLIHIKENLSEGPLSSEQILREVREKGATARLGCEFHVPKGGEAIWI